MADFFGIVISIIAILFVGYCVLAIPYYYIKKIYLYLFKKSKKINQHKTLEKFEETPSENKLVAYLCIGYVKEFFDKPELERLNWDKRKPLDNAIFRESY